MITIAKYRQEDHDPERLFNLIKDNTTPIRTSVNIITPTMHGRDTNRNFGGKILGNGNLLITRTKYFFMRWMPKLVLNVSKDTSSLRVEFKPALLTSIMMIFAGLYIVGLVRLVIIGDHQNSISGLALLAIFIVLILLELRINKKLIGQILKK